MKYENVILSGSLQVSGSLVLPSGPTNPSTGNSGDLFFNTTSGKAFGYRDEDGWNDLSSMTTYVPGISNMSYFMVAGGGGGGMDMGGGGGAGGVKSGTLSSTYESGSSFSIVVGAGGAGAPAGGSSGQGSSHQFQIAAQPGSTSSLAGDGLTTISTVGGGKGGSSYYTYTPDQGYGGDGGSGGGTSGYATSGTTRAGGTGTAGQGNDGGRGGPQYYSGGGGGAGDAGTDSTAVPHGGVGVQTSLLGYPEWFGGGGGGSAYSSTPGGNGGAGGGGGGAVGTTTGGAGLNSGSAGGGGSPNSQTNKPGGDGGANTGGGGGGGSHYNSNNQGGNGGSGAVILSYQSSSDATGYGGIVGDAGNGTRFNLFLSSDTFTIDTDTSIVTDSLQVHLDAGNFASRGTSTWTDLSGNGRNFTANNGPVLGGNFYYDLDGSNDYFGDVSYQVDDYMTIMTWIKPDSLVSADGVVDINTSGNSGGLALGSRSNNNIGFTWRDDAWSSGGYPYLADDTNLVDSNWHCIAGVYNGNAYLYVDDMSTAAQSNTSRNSTLTQVSGQYIRIGLLGNQSSTYALEGGIGMVMIYSKALTTTELLQNYNATKHNFI